MVEIITKGELCETNLSEEVFKNLARKRVILFGLPGAGKTTLVRNIIEETSEVKYLSLGEITRSVSEKSELGRRVKAFYEKVPPCPFPVDLVMEIITPYLLDAKDSGFILDGVPRRVDEAVALVDFLSSHRIPIDFSLELKVDQDLALWRLMERILKNEERRLEKTEHYQLRFRFYEENIEEILKIMSKHTNQHLVIDTSQLSPKQVMDRLALFLKGLK